MWRPYEQVDLQELDAVRLTPAETSRIEVVAPDPSWPEQYERVREVIVMALGDRVLLLAHVGSTAVPDLWAKPRIDVDLLVADSSAEDEYVPALEAAGFRLVVREPDWEEHRVLRGWDPATNLHVMSPSAIEPRRHLAFRDWLRTHPKDRAAYAELKRSLAGRGFTDGMDYNNHKAELVYDIYERIFAADQAHQHTPRPRIP